jgi:putative ABC transport system permease protein
MKNKTLIVAALRSLAHHKLRSLLTTLGIVIGIVAIVAVMAIGQGAKARIQKQIEGMGENFVIVIGGQPRTIAQQRGGGAYETIKEEDFEAVVEECDAIYQASPGLRNFVKCVYGGKNWQALMGGVASNYFEIRKWPIVRGEAFNKQDIRTSNKVVLVGQKVAKELFDLIDPVGKTIRINKMPFLVLGVLGEKGKRPDGFDEDDVLFTPVTTMQRKIKGIRNYSAILMSARSKEKIQQAAQQVRSILRLQHNLRPGDEDDFSIFTQDDIAQASEAATRILNLLLFIIASISLIVGGIGIMNIMLVTVTERTKEIGIRMALGASTFSILQQFILEAIIICLFGGLLGVAIGVSIAYLFGFLSGWPIFITPSSIVISLTSCAFIGIFFGFYPAHMASKLNPVDALADR